MQQNRIFSLGNEPVSHRDVNYAVGLRPNQEMDYFWAGNVNSVLCLSAHHEMMVPKYGSTHPLQVGFVQTFLEESHGQMADYRRTLPDGRGIHVRESSDFYTIHWDKACPLVNPIEHINQDAAQYGPVLTTLAVVGVIAGLVWLDSRRW